ncbi:Hcp family type VI secretion system effector [Schlesneria paludicola]|uniref:Hcp family type VI secretion system effector n=1 Tax=Schlesneria paludicola TaxID=360056 RepID=UPI00029A6700|nr:type VI secretion system tube protein Hcp [Schlesneria paludicola]
MAADILLEVEGITGESKIKGKEGWIDVLSISWGAANASSVHFGGGAGTAKGDTHDLSIVKRIDNASPEFFLKTMNGTHFEKATLILRLSSGGDPIEYYKMEMEGVFVTSWNPSCGGDQHGMESVSLSFRKVTVTYTGQKDDGTKGGEVPVNWNIVTGASD